MIFKNKLLFSMYLLCNIACNYNHVNKSDIPFDKNKIKDSIENYKASCVYKNQKVEIITKYQKVLNFDNEKGKIKNLVLSQVLIFYVNDKKTQSVIFPFKTSSYEVSKTKKINLVNTVITGVKYIEIKGEVIYSFYGINTIDPPHEFFAITSTEGEWIWYYYGDGKNTYKKFGDEKVLTKKYGEGVKNQKNMIKVFPLLYK